MDQTTPTNTDLLCGCQTVGLCWMHGTRDDQIHERASEIAAAHAENWGESAPRAYWGGKVTYALHLEADPGAQWYSDYSDGSYGLCGLWSAITLRVGRTYSTEKVAELIYDRIGR